MNANPRAGWTLVRGATASLAAALLLLSYATLIGGIALLWSDHADREGGYVWSPGFLGTTAGYAITSDDVHREAGGVQRWIDDVVSDVRLEVTPTDPTDVLFVGVARSADVADYLRGVAHRQVGGIAQGGEAWGWLGAGVTTDRPGGPPAVRPSDLDIWLAQSSGVGTRTLTWPPSEGDWVVVVIQADGGSGISATVRTGAAAPHLGWIAGGMVVVGTAAFAGAAYLLRRTVQRGRGPASTVPARRGGPDQGRVTDEVPVLTGR